MAVPPTAPQTNQYAELYALEMALWKIKTMFGNDTRISQIVIITDSSYLVDGLTEHVEGWVENGYKTSRGKALVNGKIIKQLHENTTGYGRGWVGGEVLAGSEGVQYGC
jgi:ribonuclease HI